MAGIKRHKVRVAWLLLAMLVLPFAFQAVHIYHAAEHSEHGCFGKLHSCRDCNDCPVCRFTLSSFTEAAVARCCFKIILFGVLLVFSFQSKACRQIFIPCGLRAPPLP